MADNYIQKGVLHSDFTEETLLVKSLGGQFGLDPVVKPQPNYCLLQDTRHFANLPRTAQIRMMTDEKKRV